MIKIVNGDCIQEMSKIEISTVNLILTDPPYNLGEFMNKRQTNLGKMRKNFFVDAGWDNLDNEHWLDKMFQFFNESYRILCDGGSMIVFMSIIRVESIIRLAENAGFYYKTTGIWHKKNPMPRNMNLHFVNSNECWIYFIKGKKTGIFNNKGLVLDFVETSLTSSKEKKFGKHPTQKPEKLMEFFIELLSNEGDLVVDPFLGSGSSAVAAVSLKRNFIGIDISKTYIEITKKRIKEVK